MKKFTFFITILISTFFARAQIDEGLQNRLQLIQEKFYLYTQQTKSLSSLPNLFDSFTTTPEISLKNAVATQKLDSTITMVLDPEEETWQNDQKQEFIYDSELKNTESFEKEWNTSTGTWEIYGKTEIEYYNDGNIYSLLFFSWDDEAHDLIPVHKLEAFYNEEEKLDSALHFVPEDNDSWALEVKQTFSYNSSGKLIQRDFLMMEEEAEDISISIIYSYNGAGNIETSSMYLKDDEEILISKTYFSYDGSGNRTSNEIWELNFISSTLEKSHRTDYEYDASGISIATHSTWDKINERWVEEEKDEFTYNNIDFSDIVFPGMMQFFTFLEMEEDDIIFKSFQKVIAEVNTFEMVDGDWENTEKTSFYYSEAVSSNIDILRNNSVVMYPNPASEWITFRWNNNYDQLLLEIFQVTGAKVMERVIFSDRPVPVLQLDNGIYFFKLLNGKETVHSGKLIKK